MPDIVERVGCDTQERNSSGTKKADNYSDRTVERILKAAAAPAVGVVVSAEEMIAAIRKG